MVVAHFKVILFNVILYIYYGNNLVSSTASGVKLRPGGSISIPISNLNLAYIDADVSGEGVFYLQYNNPHWKYEVDLRDFSPKGNANYLYNGVWYEDAAHTIPAYDNTQAFQEAYNQLGTLVSSSFDFTDTHEPVNGGRIIFPSERYFVSGSLLYKGGIILEGAGFGSVILHRPPVDNTSLFYPDLNKTTWNNIVLGAIFRNFSVKGAYSVINGTGLEGTAFDLYNTGWARVEDIFIQNFKKGYYGYWDQVHHGGYYNRILECIIKNCPLCIHLEVNQFSAALCNFVVSDNADYGGEYMVKVQNLNETYRASGITFTGCDFDAWSSEAIFYSGDAGLAINGGFSQNNHPTGRYADINVDQNQFGGFSVHGATLANRKVKFINLYKGGVQANHFLAGYPVSYGIKVGEKGTYIKGAIVNPRFCYGIYRWTTLYPTEMTVKKVTDNMYFSKQAIKITKLAGSNDVGIKQTFTLENPLPYLQCLVKKSSDFAGSIRAYINNEAYNLSELVQYGNTGWYLYGAWLPPIAKSDTCMLQYQLNATSPVGSWIEVTDIGLYANGFDYFPSEYTEEPIYSLTPPTYGDWAVGDKVYNSNPVAGTFEKWECVIAGSPGLFRGVGTIQALPTKYDLFDRADSLTSLGISTSGDAWTAYVGTWGIVDNSAYIVTPSGSRDLAGINSGLSDCKVSCVFRKVAGSPRLAFRISDSTNFLFLVHDSSITYKIYKVVGDSSKLINTYIVSTITNNALIEVILNGSSISSYINGVLLGTETVIDFQTATIHGLSGNATTSRFDRFMVEPLT